MSETSQKQRLLFIVGIIGIVLALWGVTRFVGGQSDEGKTVIVAPANPNDPKFRPDPKLAGGGGQ